MRELLPLPPVPPGDGLRVAFVRTTADLAVFFDDDIGVVSLQRPVLPVLASYAERLAKDVPFSFKAVVAFAEDGGLDALDELAAQLPPDDARDVLLQDIAYWVEVVTEMSGLPRCGVRLVRLIDRMCPAFHVDHVPFRLLCTYAGAGTEWLDEQGGIHRAAGMDVTLLKGTNGTGRGAVHRSPVSERPRILLTIEPVG